MSRDNVHATVEKLLLLAADGSNPHEATAAALKAAQLFKAERLSFTNGPPRGERCIMCQPAVRPGQCNRCGLTGRRARARLRESLAGYALRDPQVVDGEIAATRRRSILRRRVRLRPLPAARSFFSRLRRVAPCGHRARAT